MHRKTIAIIGGGFCGTMVAVHLLRQTQQPVEVFLINKGYPKGKGVAYSASSEKYLLNVHAGRMSAFPDQPAHFVEWLKTQPAFEASSLEEIGHTFVPRQLYGQYLEAILQETIATHSQVFTEIHDRAIAISSTKNLLQETYQLTLQSGSQVEAEQVVLALGNFKPANLRCLLAKEAESLAPSLYVSDPWQPDTLKGLAPSSTVVLLGTGLTTIDALLGLQEQNFTGKVYAVSSNGYLPRPYLSGKANVDFGDRIAQANSLLEMVRIFNQELKANSGQGWEEMINGIRPHTHALWQKLTLHEQRKFVARLGSLWSVVRHRLPPQVHTATQEMQQAGQLHIVAGRVQSMVPGPDKVEVTIQPRQVLPAATILADRILNCTGPQLRYEAVPDALVQSLLRQELAVPHPLHMGLQVDALGSVLRPDGSHSQSLFTLGSSRRGNLWESNAIAELREQAFQLARHLSQPFFGYFLENRPKTQPTASA
ncbi:FAD/NAD(P)-binding protein [Nibribacter koreensis]|uniref:FAD/NAD(P)-binding protein n=1 Tax=Nibribacter koreensis TaxID=1084519 RepID=A0ABP8FJL8_9BACT